MYQYPLKITFSLFSLTPQVTVTDASGKTLFTAVKKLLSDKDEININNGSAPLFQVISQESRITDIPSNWDIRTADGQTLGVVDDDFIDALDDVTFSGNALLNGIASQRVGDMLNLKTVKMYWIKDTNGGHLGFIAPDKQSLMATGLPLLEIVQKLPLFFRFITPRYHIVLDEKKVMSMKKERTLMQDTYIIEAHEAVNEGDERLLIPSAVLAVLYERQQLKALYS